MRQKLKELTTKCVSRCQHDSGGRPPFCLCPRFGGKKKGFDFLCCFFIFSKSQVANSWSARVHRLAEGQISVQDIIAYHRICVYDRFMYVYIYIYLHVMIHVHVSGHFGKNLKPLNIPAPAPQWRHGRAPRATETGASPAAPAPVRVLNRGKLPTKPWSHVAIHLGKL